MAQLISGLDAVYKRSRNSWQDTSAPPNLLIRHLGPGEISLDLQTYLDIANQSYHRESMKGQTADVPNLVFLFKVPATLLLTPKDISTGDRVHRDSLSGQVGDPQNFILPSAIFNPSPGQPGSVVINPVFNKHPTQETTIQRNPVLDVIIAGTLPFPSPVFENEQTYWRDSLGGQYGRSGAIVPLGVPPSIQDTATYVAKPKATQEPYQFPNVILLGIAPLALPFVYPQSEDHQWRRPKVQETYTYPNVLALTKPVTTPFIHPLIEDAPWKAHAVQEPIVYQNSLVRLSPPIIIQPFVQQQYEHLQFKPHPAQAHYDFPNVIIYQITPLPPPVITGLIMPNVVGQILQMALDTLQRAGILVPAKLGYFGTYPITVLWVPSTDTHNAGQDTVHHGVVIAQSIAPSTKVKANTPITLTVLDYPENVAFP